MTKYSVKETLEDSVEFAKQLARFVLAMAFLFISGYAVYHGRKELSIAAMSSALILAGALVGLSGLFLLYKTLMRKD